MSTEEHCRGCRSFADARLPFEQSRATALLGTNLTTDAAGPSANGGPRHRYLRQEERFPVREGTIWIEMDHLVGLSSDVKSPTGPRCVSFSGLRIDLMLVI
jgi:hypothetical protein